MKAMILAAGRGKRMMPLTADTPKPLLKVAGKPLLQHHIEKLKAAGIKDIVINHCYLGEQIEAFFGDGSKFGVSIQWSAETIALETAGGLRQALPLLGEQPFLSVNGDIWTDISFEKLLSNPHIRSLEQTKSLAHLVLVNNPAQNPGGDFGLREDQVVNIASQKWTYSGVALYNPALIANCEPGVPQGLAPLLRQAADKMQVTGELHQGLWHDIGTPDRLAALDNYLKE